MTEIDERQAGGLLPPSSGDAQISVVEGQRGHISVGRLTVELDHQGNLRFLRSDDGTELTAEEPIHFQWPGPRNFTSEGNGYFRLEQQFRAYANERFYGLGQHQHGRLDQKGACRRVAAAKCGGVDPVSRFVTRLWPALEQPRCRPRRTRTYSDTLGRKFSPEHRLLVHCRLPARDRGGVCRSDRPRPDVPGVGYRLLAVETPLCRPR